MFPIGIEFLSEGVETIILGVWKLSHDPKLSQTLFQLIYLLELNVIHVFLCILTSETRSWGHLNAQS